MFTTKLIQQMQRNIDRDMHRLSLLKKAYDTADKEGNQDMKSVYRGQWYALVEHIAKEIKEYQAKKVV